MDRGLVGEHVGRVGDHDDEGVAGVLRQRRQDVVAQVVDVLLEQVEAGLVGLAGDASGDDDEVGAVAGLVAGAAERDAVREVGAVQHVQHLALGAIGDDVDDGELVGDALEHELKQRGRADAARSADNCDFHH